MTALKARLQGRAGLAGVQITDGHAWQPKGDYIAILHAEPHQLEPVSIRRTTQPREETFDLHVEISAIRTGDAEHTQAVARAYALAAELETEIREDMTINGTLPSGWAIVTSLGVRKLGPDPKGAREALILALVHCRARI